MGSTVTQSRILSTELPDNKFRAFLCRHSKAERRGHLPANFPRNPRKTIYHFFRAYNRPIYFSDAFYMPSLCWRGLRLQSEGNRPELRWAIGILVFERHGCSSNYDWAAPDPAPGNPGRPGRFLGLIQLNPEVVLPAKGRPVNDNPEVCIGEAHVVLPSAYRRGNWHACQHVAGTEYGLPGFFAISGLFRTVSPIECTYYAAHSALMMLSDRLQCQPLGTLDIVKHLLDSVRAGSEEMRSNPGLFHAFQEKLQVIHLTPDDTFWKNLWKIIPENFHTVFDLIASAISHDPRLDASGRTSIVSANNTGFSSLPDGFSSSIFNAGAVTEVIHCPEFVGDSTEDGNGEFDWFRHPAVAQEFWERLVDYLSDGFPVVVAAAGDQLPEYKEIVDGIVHDLTEEKDGNGGLQKGYSEADVRDAPHAFLVYGYHLTQPNDYNQERLLGQRLDSPRVTRLQHVDKFLITDLAWSPLIEVAATNLLRAAIRKRFSQNKFNENMIQFLVVLPKGVRLSLGKARQWAMQVLRSGVWTRPVPKDLAPAATAFDENPLPLLPTEHRQFYLTRAALYEKQTTWYRFCKAIDDKCAKKMFSRRLGLDGDSGSAPVRSRHDRSDHVWAVEFHPVANRDGHPGPFSTEKPLPGDRQSEPYMIVLLDAGFPDREPEMGPIAVILPHSEIILVGEEQTEYHFTWESVCRV